MRKKLLSDLISALALGCVFMVAAGCQRNAVRHFGPPFTDAPTATISQLLTAPESFHRKSVRIQGRIERQCPASGCWFVLDDGAGASLKVELGDYLPRLPQNIGRQAEVEGELIKHGDKPLLIGTRVTFGAGAP